MGAAKASSDIEWLLNQTLVSNWVVMMLGWVKVLLLLLLLLFRATRDLLFDGDVADIFVHFTAATLTSCGLDSNITATVALARINWGSISVKQRGLTPALKDFGRVHDSAQRTTQPTVHIPESDLITGIHPPKPFAWDKLEIDTDVPILDLDLVRHVDHVEFLRDYAVKVHEGFCDPVFVVNDKRSDRKKKTSG
jgi:hypothetical protein